MRKLTVGYMYINDRIYPVIRLQGRWLEKAGFEVGDKVVVDVRKGRIVIVRRTSTSLYNPSKKQPIWVNIRRKKFQYLNAGESVCQGKGENHQDD